MRQTGGHTGIGQRLDEVEHIGRPGTRNSGYDVHKRFIIHTCDLAGCLKQARDEGFVLVAHIGVLVGDEHPLPMAAGVLGMQRSTAAS